MKQNFQISKENSGAFRSLGVNLIQGKGELVNQSAYANSMTEIHVAEKRPNRPLNDKESRSYRALIGSINWIDRQTRPDLAFDVCELSTNLKQPFLEDL